MASPSPISLGLLLCGAISLSLQVPITTQASRSNAPPIDIGLSKPSTPQDVDFAVTYPSRVDSQGNHLSYTLRGTSRHGHSKRDTTEHDEALYFRVDAFGKGFVLNVSTNSEFVSENMAVEYVGHNGSRLQQPADGFEHCYHTGHVMDAGGKSEGWVAISNCRGLHGVIAASSGYYFIEPVDRDDSTKSQHAIGQQHIVYRSPVHDRNSGPSCAHAQEASKESTSHEPPSMRSTTASPDAEEQPNDRLRRSVVTERYIETAIVADRTMLEKHGRRNLESYLYSLMNVVSHLYKDPSIGHAIRVVLVKTIILETDQPGLSLSAHGHGSLTSFCQWQRTLNDGPSPHHDIAVLITHRNICETGDTNCGTLGIAKQGGVCDQAGSCNINEDSGLRTAFTIAHEIGHNLNLHHDGDPMLQCTPEEHYLMAPSFADSANPHHWSNCSRVQMEHFLSSPDSQCLDNPPPSGPFTGFSGSPPLPGMEYSFLEQCQLLLGPSATHCPGMPDECRLLWCKVDGRRCAHQHSPPAPGTACNLTSEDTGVCYQGECVDYASVMVPVDGGWGEWGPWNECSRSCGTGVQYSERECNSPLPANGGSYCLGPWRRYQTCQTHRCHGQTPDSYRQELCKTDPPHDRYSEWEAPTLDYIFWHKLDPCKHHCLPRGANVLPFTKAQLQDGAPCITPVDHINSVIDYAHPNRAPSQGVCIDGECVPVGCDGKLYGTAHRDECGVWCGNGTSCSQLSGQYSDVYNAETYTYYNAITIPEGSANIHVEQTETSLSDFIAAKTNTYFLNGDWTVVSDLLYEYWFAGAMWFYEKPPNARSYLRTEGPINESVSIQLLAVTQDAGLRYSFSAPKASMSPLLGEREVLYYWDTVGGQCEGVCGEGVRRREVRCVVLEEGSNATVDDAYCDAAVRPAEVEACPLEACHWATGLWTECDAVCGEGSQTRTVNCEIQNEDGTCTAIEDSRCDPDTRPPETKTCSRGTCLWVASHWTECDAVCGEGSQTRSVSCQVQNGNGTSDTVSSSHCNPAAKPPETKTCSRGSCLWVVSQWTECDAVCGAGSQTRTVSCRIQNGNGTSEISASHCNRADRPSEVQTCSVPCQWSTGQWTECDAFCGEGSQSRSIVCQKQNRNGTSTLIDAAHCERVSRPSGTQSCQAEPCQNFQWVASEWSECDGECGEGSQSRTISCQHQNGTTVPDHFCSWQEKPRDTTRTCSTGKTCPPPTTAPADPECINTDTDFFCATIVRVRLCHLYGRVCCKSCAGA